MAVNNSVTTPLPTMEATSSVSSTPTPTSRSIFSTISSTIITNTSVYTTSSTSANITEDEIPKQELEVFMPTVVFILILAVVGLFGNALVLFVYRSKRHKSPSSIFIMAIAVFDLVANVLCVPGEIYHIFHVQDVIPSVCHLLSYVTTSTTIISALLLLAVAVARYRKICRPFGRQVTVSKAKIIIVCICVAGWIFAIPNGVIYGGRQMPTTRPGTVRHICSVADNFVNTLWPAINLAFFTLLFLSVFIPLVVLYCVIGVKAYKHRKTRVASISPKNATGTSSSCVSDSTTERTKRNVVRNVNSPGNSKGSEIDISMVRELTVKLNRIKSEEDTSEEGQNGGHETSVMCEKTDQGPLFSEKESKGDNNMSAQTNNLTDTMKEEDNKRISLERTGDTDDASLENSEQQSGLASRLQWIDLTYCPDDGNDEPAAKEDKEAMSVKSSRKVSKQSSLLQKEKNFREQLMDTLTRRRGTKKDEALVAKDKNKCDTESDMNGDGKELLDQLCHNTNKSTQAPKSEARDVEHTHPGRNKTSFNAVKNSASNSNKPSIINRTTRILILITVVFFVSFVPHFSVVFFRLTLPSNYHAMSTSSKMFSHLFLRSFFLNSAINPIIYSICDANFRQDATSVFACLTLRTCGHSGRSSSVNNG